MKHLLFLVCIGAAMSAQAQTWHQVTVPSDDPLRAIDFPSESVGYIAGDSAILLKTIDGGATWFEVNYLGINSPFIVNFSDIDFVNETTGFIVVSNSAIGPFKTTDGGLTWTELVDSSSNMCFKHCVYPETTNDCFLGGAGCFQSGQIAKYESGTWTASTVVYESFNPSEIVVQMDFRAGVGLAAMNGPYMLRSTDAGTTWDTLSVGLSATGVLTSVLFTDDTTAWAGYDENGGGFGILKSIDAGQTWAMDMSSATFFYPAFLSLTHASNGDIYAGARPSFSPEGLIFETPDNGTSWVMELVDQAIFDMASYGTDVTWGVGDSGYVVVNTPIANLSTFEQELLALEVYPNPTNDILNVHLLQPANEVTVYSLTGQEMLRKEIGGMKQIQLNVSELSTGIYLIKTESASPPVRFVKH